MGILRAELFSLNTEVGQNQSNRTSSNEYCNIFVKELPFVIWRLTGKIQSEFMLESGLLSYKGRRYKFHGGGRWLWPLPWEKRLVCQRREQASFLRFQHRWIFFILTETTGLLLRPVNWPSSEGCLGNFFLSSIDYGFQSHLQNTFSEIPRSMFQLFIGELESH